MLCEFEHHEVFDALKHLEDVYPGFSVWYHSKVLPGLKDGTRRIFAEVDSFGSEKLSGIAIAKRGSESKLCTLWVRPDRRNGDLSWILSDRALRWIGNNRPMFTIPDDKLPQFRSLLNSWDCGNSQKVQNAYRPGMVEHVFNGKLENLEG